MTGYRDSTIITSDGRLTVEEVETIDVPSVSAAGVLSVGTGDAPERSRTWVEDDGTLTVIEGAGSPTEPYTGPQIVLVGYGQSNWLRHLTISSSPPSADADTYWWDPDNDIWTTPPTGNGIRETLNAIATATGKTVGIVSHGVSGVGIDYLSEGDASGAFTELAARIDASRASEAEENWILWHQGEGDANFASPNATTYNGKLDTLHQSIVDELGRTKAQAPLICSGLATVTEGSFTFPDSSWAEIQKALVIAHDTYANIHYSHSNYDAVLSDGVHWTAASYGRSGARYARTLLALRGDVATAPAWFISAVTQVDETHTDVTVVHSMGTDFTPTSGITGFEISGNNGADWEEPTAARQDATTIRLTHTDFGTVNDRLVRYQYGKTPDVSDPVLDNGSLAAPLTHTAHQTLTAEGSGALPVPSYLSVSAMARTGAGPYVHTASGVAIGDAASDRLLIIGVTRNQFGSDTETLTITPNSGSPVVATLVRRSNQTGPTASIYQALVPTGTTADFVLDTSGSGMVARMVLWSVPSDDMSSTTAVDHDTTRVTAPTAVASLEMDSSEGGFIIGLAVASANDSTAGAFSGDESYTERVDTVSSGTRTIAADASDTGAHTGDQTVTVTYGSVSFAMVLVAASWR